MRSIFVCLTGAGLALSGCTTTGLETRGDVRTSASTLATRGLPYSLPMAQFDITVTHTIAQCFAPDAAGNATTTPEMVIATTYAAVPVSVPGETYLIDPEALSGPLKTSDLSIVNFPTGTLQSINASVQDRTGVLISAGLSATLRGISIVAGIPAIAQSGDAALSEAESVPVQLICADAAPALLATLKTATDNLKAAQSILDATNEELLALAARVADETATDAQVARLGTLRSLVAGQAAAVVRGEAALTRAKSALSVTFAARWPDRFAVTHQGAVMPVDSALGRFSHLLTVGRVAVGGTPCASSASDAGSRALATDACLRSGIGVAMQLRPAVSAVATNAVADENVDPSMRANGMFVRPPVRGHLVLCRGVVSCPASGPTGGNIWVSTEVWIPQMGQLRLLEYRNQPLENDSLSLTLDQSGNIVNASYKNTDAAGVEIARIVDDALGAVAEFDVRVREASSARRERAREDVIQGRADELAAAQHELALTRANRELELANNPPDTAELVSVTADTALINARAARAQAELAERAARMALAEAQAQDADKDD